MILNSATVVTLIVAVATAVIASLALVAAIRIARLGWAAGPPELRARRERLWVLLGALAFNVVLTRFLSWPCTLFELRSLAPIVPGAMCGYGVLQSTPALSFTLAASKLAAAFALVLTLMVGRADRRLRGALGSPRLIVTSVAMLLAVGDALADLAFLFAERDTLVVSCCTTVVDVQDRLSLRLPQTVLGPGAATKLLGLFGGLAFGSIALAWWAARRTTDSLNGSRRWLLAAASIAGLLLFPVGLLTAMEWIAPVVLHLPNHHCPLEAWTETPDGAVMLVLLLAGSMLPAAAFLLSWFGRRPETVAALAGVVRRALHLGALATAAVLVMFASHLAVAELMP